MELWYCPSQFDLSDVYPCKGMLINGLPHAENRGFFHSGHEGREVPMVPNLLCIILTTLKENCISGLYNLAMGFGQYHNDAREIDLLCSVIICPSNQFQFAFGVVPP